MRTNKSMNGFINILLVGACGYSAFLALIYFYQPRLLFFPNIPSRQVEVSPDEVGLPYESVNLVTNVIMSSWMAGLSLLLRLAVLYCFSTAMPAISPTVSTHSFCSIR